MQASISIVVPAHHDQRYIDQCLKSILCQLRPHHELIVVDDGSRDSTLARAFKAQEAWTGNNFHIFSQEHGGMASARNHCLRVAQGDYIAFVDADDVLLPGALAAMDQAIAAGAPDVLACDFRFWHPDDAASTRCVRLGYPVGKLLRDQETILNTFFADRQMYVWSNVFRREIYARLADPVFPPGRMFEDVATVPRLMGLCKSLVHLPHPVIDYRQHPGESAVSEKWCIDFASALPVARRHLQACGVPDSVRRHFDVAAAYFYVGVVKNSYRLPRAEGRRVRSMIKPLFVGGLFNDCATLVATAGRADMLSNDRTLDAVIIRQVESALAGGLVLNFKRAATRKIKLWRRLRQVHKHRAAPVPQVHLPR